MKKASLLFWRCRALVQLKVFENRAAKWDQRSGQVESGIENEQRENLNVEQVVEDELHREQACQIAVQSEEHKQTHW